MQREAKKTFTRGRTTALVFAAAFAVAGAGFLAAGLLYSAKINRIAAERFIDVPVDLATPGTYTGTFTQTYAGSHGMSLLLEIPEETLATLKPEEIPASCRFTVTCPPTEHEVLDLPWDDYLGKRSSRHTGAIDLNHFRPLANTTFGFTFTSSLPIPALAGVPQRLTGRYGLCGLERLPGHFGVCLGVLGLLVGLGIGGAVRSSIRKQTQQALAPQQPATPTPPSAPVAE
ncbi:MAG: hypothetical protein GX591_14215 [Planctomycetes bacterium]|nr:hypothetical protein [Planctomycetota bacterium]